ncbi:hypothetical protein AYI68_g2121 [Smittium mucronatum]|uniref:Uncharacterized protein n=1 Tax=Smittium mucronatum TaxID=133383 RepID=A0A1R0H3I0_9FUNG|nr:hypothetical protein AYI68_g2121 [Smittium mucronatum]
MVGEETPISNEGSNNSFRISKNSDSVTVKEDASAKININNLGNISPENMTNDDLEMFFGEDQSSELSDFDLSGSEADQIKIKKENNSSDNDRSGDYDPVSEKYIEVAKKAGNVMSPSMNLWEYKMQMLKN